MSVCCHFPSPGRPSFVMYHIVMFQINCLVGSQFQNLAYIVSWKHALSSEKLAEGIGDVGQNGLNDLHLDLTDRGLEPFVENSSDDLLNVVSRYTDTYFVFLLHY